MSDDNLREERDATCGTGDASALPDRAQGADGRPAAPSTTGSMPRVKIDSTEQGAGGDSEAGASAPQRPEAPAGAHPAPVSRTVEERHTVVKTKTKKLPVFFAAFGGFVLGAVLLIALVMTGALDLDRNKVEVSAGSGAATTIDIDPEDTTLAEAVAAKCLPSVASISTQTAEGGGVGSGVVIDKDGNILTNYHVVEGAEQLSVSLGGSMYDAEVVGSDPSSDLAVVHVDAPADALVPMEIADSDNITVGEWVMAIGSPFGNEQSVSTGIVSSLYRSTALPSSSGTSIYANMIQTDAAINPGNSGGALVNDEGQLIGINSIIESYSGSSSGVGFAIPSNYAADIASQIIAGKTPVHPYLGVTLTSVTPSAARENNLATDTGAYVVDVVEGGPADAAGIRKGDVVTKIGDDEVTSADNLIISIREHAVGDSVTLTVMRGEHEETVEVTLGSDEALQEEQQDTSTGEGSGNSMSDEEFRRYLEELLGANR